MPILVLPRSLGPSDRGNAARDTRGFPLLPKIVRKPGTSDAVVRVCQQAIFSAAKPLGAVGVQAASAGPVRRQRSGLTAPLSVSVTRALLLEQGSETYAVPTSSVDAVRRISSAEVEAVAAGSDVAVESASRSAGQLRAEGSAARSA